jgi:ABC-type polysaccharide/polyol phosphate transport system ATPase subunit
MPALEVANVGVKFELHHQRENTLTGSVVGFFQRKKEITITNETFWALSDVTFTVKEGESVGIIGKNGAGKSTLLQVLAGLYKPDVGTVSRKGRVGLLQLGTGFHPDLTGRDNIYLNGAILGLRKREIDQIYDSIVSFSELEKFIDIPIKNYSSGMIARLGFSIAINVRPDIILIDEVLSVGDDGFKMKSKEQIYKLREIGRTIVYVSHSLSEVQSFCDKAIFIHQGKIVFEGGTSEACNVYTDFDKQQTL